MRYEILGEMRRRWRSRSFVCLLTRIILTATAARDTRAGGGRAVQCVLVGVGTSTMYIYLDEYIDNPTVYTPHRASPLFECENKVRKVDRLDTLQLLVTGTSTTIMP